VASRFHFFRWREAESLVTGQVVLRPMVDVRLLSGPSRARTDALIDTGAPVTVFPRGVADKLDVDLPDEGSGGDEAVIMLGERWPCVVRTVTLVLPPFEDLEWDAPVRFSINEGLPFALLGYEGFLNRWAVTFNAYRGYTVVETIESLDERIPIDTWDEFQKDFDGWDRPG
jgi:predicted aspartyl protease